MKRFFRDCAILKPEIKEISKMLLLSNGLVLFLWWGTDKINFYENSLIDPSRFFLMGLLLPVNAGLIGGFFLRYFGQWKEEIQEAFDNYDRKEKYDFVYKRFNKSI